MNDFVGGFGSNPDYYVDRSVAQKEILIQNFRDFKDELYSRCRVEANFDDDKFIGISGPSGSIFVDFELISDGGNEICYVCYFYDLIRSEIGLSPRRLYALVLHSEGRWSDSTGKDLSFDVVRQAHRWSALTEIVARVIREQVSLNNERLDEFLKKTS